MQAIFKRAMLFVHDGGLKVAVQPSATPQVVPDWVGRTEAFDLGVSEDSIIDLARPKPQKKDAEPVLQPVGVQLPRINMDHVKFLGVDTIAQAKEKIEKMSEKDQDKFFTDFAAEQKKKADAAAAKQKEEDERLKAAAGKVK